MKLTTLRLNNFYSFGGDGVSIDLEAMTFLAVRNGAMKTALLRGNNSLFQRSANWS